MLKRCFAIGLLLSLSSALLADDKPKHNTLTPKEVADGWILLFDGDSTFGWQAPQGSKWTVADGMLAPQADKPGLLVTTTAFADYELQLDYARRVGAPTPDDRARPSVEVRFGCDQDGKPRDPNNRWELPFTGNSFSTVTFSVRDGRIRDVTTASSGLRASFRMSVGITEKGDGSKPTKQSGHIVLSGNGVVYRNIKLKPLDTKPLFNGKDLTGWKKYTGDDKRAKTEFTVTPEGWLHLKNGPGDLQTKDQYQDFILQAECLSNGKHLNSGIFFRCIPEQYQNGYEAQIHNGWTEKLEKEYTIDEYDPQTHKLKGKEKIKSAAMDYGTGAIYRRVPARKAVAKDNEWFTMTIAAQGRHIATWVNGVQVVDWTDNRLADENPRNGCKVEKGAISLQGHDPTTDLSFRNIRIAELPQDKK
jgi:hypothetical protein